MRKSIDVLTGEVKAAKENSMLKSAAIGSCIVVSAINLEKRIGAQAHIMLPGKYKIEIVDPIVNHRLSKEDQIVAVPTLIRQLPPPVKKIIGDLSDEIKVLVGLDIRPDNNK